jgi:coproporphyrinogen III oxidase-like Fe-S oxidoreductase
LIAETVLARVMRRKVAAILGFHERGHSEASPPEPDPGRAYLLYAHVPFCEALCPYCSFNRVRLEPDLARRYFRALRYELELYDERGWRFDALYVGGGTPTVLPAELEALMARVRELWPIRSVSVETNPNHLTPQTLDLLESAGVNRLSVGVQSFDDGILRSIGRYERYGSAAEIAGRLETARGRFDTLNVDLIFNYPGQSEEMFLRDLAEVRRLELDQVTFYPLMAARGVRRRLRELGTVDPRQERRLYRLIRGELGRDYELSSAWCFSRRREPAPGAEGTRMIDEYVVEHDQYAGLGSGSFGYARGVIYANTFAIPEYVERISRGELPVVASRTFSKAERVRYDFLMRLFGGELDLQELATRYGRGVRRLLWKELAFLRATGAVRPGGSGRSTLALTARGYYFWVILMREFFTGVNNFREQCLTLQTEGEPLGSPV